MSAFLLCKLTQAPGSSTFGCGQVDPAALCWEVRAPLLLAEVLEADADVVCLQECNRYSAPTCWSAAKSLCLWHYCQLEKLLAPYDMNLVSAGDFFEPEMRQRGYTGLFWPKQCSPAEQYGFPCDGCALFYRNLRLEPVDAPTGMGPCRRRP